ncbi:hypothetical protein FRC02_007442, partial [Tulasnella sp. 418]
MGAPPISSFVADPSAGPNQLQDRMPIMNPQSAYPAFGPAGLGISAPGSSTGGPINMPGMPSDQISQPAQQLVQPPEPPQTQQQSILQPNPSDPLPDLSHLQAWPSREQFAEADAHIQLLLREAMRQRELERPVPIYDIPATEDMLYSQKFQEACSVALHIKQLLALLYILSPKEENALKMAIHDLVKVMQQQRVMRPGPKLYFLTLPELDLMSTRGKKLLMYHAQLLRAAEKLPGFPQTPQQPQSMPPPATIPNPPTQARPARSRRRISSRQTFPVSFLQPLVHDNTQVAPVTQHSSPPADSHPFIEQSQLQPSANGITSSNPPTQARPARSRRTISIKLPPPVGFLQPLVHDNTQVAPVTQHTSPSADSPPFIEQSQLQPSAN